MKKFCQLLVLSGMFSFILPSYAQISLGQTLQIYTHFTSIVGKPEWLLEIREAETGRVLPYLYEVKEQDNYWIAFTAGRSYRVVASTLKFGPYARIKNFCKLENGIISDESMTVTLSGELTPSTRDFRCVVRKFKNYQLF
jgi:hypothetical protein